MGLTAFNPGLIYGRFDKLLIIDKLGLPVYVSMAAASYACNNNSCTGTAEKQELVSSVASLRHEQILVQRIPAAEKARCADCCGKIKFLLLLQM